jgi:prophage regulatory protein
MAKSNGSSAFKSQRLEWQERLERAFAEKQAFDYWREPKVLDTTGLRRSTMRQMVKDGLFPPPVKLSERSSGWVSTLVQEWQRQRIEQHRQAA